MGELGRSIVKEEYCERRSIVKKKYYEEIEDRALQERRGRSDASELPGISLLLCLTLLS